MFDSALWLTVQLRLSRRGLRRSGGVWLMRILVVLLRGEYALKE